MKRVGTGAPETPPETPGQPFGTACLRVIQSTAQARYARRLGPIPWAFGLDGLMPWLPLPSRPTGSGDPPLRGGSWGHPRRGRGTPLRARSGRAGRCPGRTPRSAGCPGLRQGCWASPPNTYRPLGRSIPAGAGIRCRLPPARRGLLVCLARARHPHFVGPLRRSSAALRPASASSWPWPAWRWPALAGRPISVPHGT